MASTIARYHENKAAVEDKYIGAGQDDHGPLHSLHALRPLTTEVARRAGTGASWRGEEMEITTFWKSDDLGLQGKWSILPGRPR